MAPRTLFVGALAGLLLLSIPLAWAQAPAKPTPLTATAATPVFATPAPAAVRQFYAATDSVSSILYNGPEYIDYARRYAGRDGHQFFLTPEQQPGHVVYRGQTFDGLQLRYDIVLDQIVLGQPTNPLTLRLVNEQLPRFTLAGHRFERLVADSAASSELSTGYYEVLHEGRVQLLARRAKRQQERIEGRIVTIQFIPVDKLFARKDGTVYLLNSKAAVLNLFADRAAETQVYLKQNKLKLRKKQLENVAVLLATFYDTLPPR